MEKDVPTYTLFPLNVAQSIFSSYSSIRAQSLVKWWGSAKAEVESSCALEVGVHEGCDRETKSGGEWLSQVGDVVEEGFEREELGAGSDGTSYY